MAGSARKRLRTVAPNAGRVALYVRVSAVRGRAGDDFHSPEVQVDGMRKLAVQDGLREVEVVNDDIDVSGQTFDRPGIARIRQLVEAGSIDVVAVFMLSRVGRRLAESLTFIGWLRDRNVRVVSVTERIDDTPEGQFMVGLWLNLAELQGNQIGATWARIIERRARRGQHHGRPNHGYIVVDGRMQADPVLGPAVTELFRGYAAGTPTADLARAFGEARGRPISATQIRTMLRNPVYRGRIVIDTVGSGVLDLDGEHPALVDEATWQRCQRRAADDQVAIPRHLEPSYGLTGLIRCHHCGGALIVYPQRKRGQLTLRLFCSNRRDKRGCAGIGYPPYTPIEQAILDEVAHYGQKLRGNPGAVRAQRVRLAKAGVDVRTLERQLTETRNAMARLTERWARRQVPDATYQTTIDKLDATETAQAQQLAGAQERREEPPPEKVVALVEHLLRLWPRMTGAEQNRALKALVRAVTVRAPASYREPGPDRITSVTFRW